MGGPFHSPLFYRENRLISIRDQAVFGYGCRAVSRTGRPPLPRRPEKERLPEKPPVMQGQAPRML